MANQSLKTPESVDDRIANETHAMYQYEHKASTKFTLSNLLTYTKQNRPIAVAAIALVVLIGAGGVAALVSSSNNEDKALAANSKDAELEDEGVYGLDSESYYYPGAQNNENSTSTATNDTSGEGNVPGSSSGSPGTTGSTSVNSSSSNATSSKSKARTTTPSKNVPTYPTQPTNPATSIQPAPVISSSINVVSWNYPHSRSVSNMVSGVKALSKTADVIGLQEFGPKDKRDALKSLVRNCGSCGYALYMPDFRDGGNVPIVWKKDKFQLLETHFKKIYDKQTVESGANGTTATAKHLLWVKLREKKTGQSFFFINNHLIPSAIKDGRPHPDRPKTAALYKKHVSTLADLVANLQKQSPVVITGDFNINHKADSKVKYSGFPYAKLNARSVWSNWRALGTSVGGTHGANSYIDYVWTTRTSILLPTAHKVLPTYGSDHNALRTTIRLQSR